jgi:hypothetical protein
MKDTSRFFVTTQPKIFQASFCTPSNMKQIRHARESGHPEVMNAEGCVLQERQAWIPAHFQAGGDNAIIHFTLESISLFELSK